MTLKLELLWLWTVQPGSWVPSSDHREQYFHFNHPATFLFPTLLSLAAKMKVSRYTGLTWTLSLSCPHFCFAYITFILATVFSSDHCIFAEISLWIYDIAFSEVRECLLLRRVGILPGNPWFELSWQVAGDSETRRRVLCSVSQGQKSALPSLSVSKQQRVLWSWFWWESHCGHHLVLWVNGHIE